MHSIVIEMKVTRHAIKEFEVPDTIYEEIKRTGRIPDDYFNQMEETCDDTAADTEYDYLVFDDDIGKTIVDWCLKESMYE